MTPSLSQAEGCAKGDYVPLDGFLKAPAQVGWASYLARPLWWGLGAAKRRLIGDGSQALGEGADEAQWTTHKGEWVVRELVEVSLACGLGYGVSLRCSAADISSLLDCRKRLRRSSRNYHPCIPMLFRGCIRCRAGTRRSPTGAWTA